MTDAEKYFIDYLNSKSKKVGILIKCANTPNIKKSEYFNITKNILCELEDVQKLRKSLKIKNIYPNNLYNNFLLLKNKNVEIVKELNQTNYEEIIQNRLCDIENKIKKEESLNEEEYKLLEFYLLNGVITHDKEETIYNFLIKEALIRENHISYKAFEKLIIFFTKLKMNENHVCPICQIKTQKQIDEIIRKKATKKRISIPKEEIKDLYYNGNYELLKNLFYDLACIKNYKRKENNEIDTFFEKELKEEILANYLPSYYKNNDEKISFIVEAKIFALKTLNKLFELLGINFKNLDNPFTKEIEKLEMTYNDNKRLYKKQNFTVDELFEKLSKVRPEVLKYLPAVSIEDL